jgi:hypothetical protein
MKANRKHAVAYVNKLVSGVVTPVTDASITHHDNSGLISFRLAQSDKRDGADEHVFSLFNKLHAQIGKKTGLAPSTPLDVFNEFIVWRLGTHRHIELAIDVEENTLDLHLVDRN